MGPRQSRNREDESNAAIYHYDEPPTQPGTRTTVAGVCRCHQHTRNLRVLSVDGGGVRGLIPLYFLAMLEERTGKSCTDLFDLFAGTSVGGLIVMSLNVPDPESDPPRPKHSARQLYDWFKENAPVLFPINNTSRDVRSLQGMIGARYDAKPVEDTLQQFFGETWLSECIRDTMAVAYEITRGHNFFFKSRVAWRDSAFDFPLWQVCRATTAAPTYYKPCQIILRDSVTPDQVLTRPPIRVGVEGAKNVTKPPPRTEPARKTKVSAKDAPAKKAKVREADQYTITLIDGGVFANNPSMCACAEGLACYEYVKTTDDIFMLSLGTGYFTRQYDSERSQSWGAIDWIGPLIEIMMDGGTTATHYQMLQILNDKTYFRFDVNITPREQDRAWLKEQGASEGKLSVLGNMGSTDPLNIAYLEYRMKEYLERPAVAKSLDEMVARLTMEIAREKTILEELMEGIQTVAQKIEDAIDVTRAEAGDVQAAA